MIYNSVLKNSYEVNFAIDRLDSLGLFPHPDRVKSWDTYRIVNLVSRADRVSFILDVGCNCSPIMPILKRLGFKNLYGCDLLLKNIDYTLMQVDYSLNRPITEIYEDNTFNFRFKILKKLISMIICLTSLHRCQ